MFPKAAKWSGIAPDIGLRSTISPTFSALMAGIIAYRLASDKGRRVQLSLKVGVLWMLPRARRQRLPAT